MTSKSNILEQRYDNTTLERFKNQLDHIQRLAGVVEQSIADSRTILCAYLRRNRIYDFQCMNEMITEAEKNAEFLTERLRRIVLQLIWEPRQYEEYKKGLIRAHGINISYGNGILSIDIPALIPHRKAEHTDYIYKPLFLAFQQWCINRRESNMEIPRYEKATVCFVHCYNQDASHARVRDNDNIEEKHVLDALDAFFLKSDSGLCVNTYHAAALGKTDRTYLSVMPNERFAAWIAGENGACSDIEKNSLQASAISDKESVVKNQVTIGIFPP